jgi:hypothetical protein
MTMHPIPAVKAYLTNLIQESAILGETAVTYGNPARDIERTSFWIAETDEDDTEWVTLGPGRDTDEKFSLIFELNYADAGLTQQEATEGVFDMFSSISDLVGKDPNLDGLLVYPCLVSVKSWKEHPSDEGRWTEISGRFRCHARRQPG